MTTKGAHRSAESSKDTHLAWGKAWGLSTRTWAELTLLSDIMPAKSLAVNFSIKVYRERSVVLIAWSATDS